MGWNGQQFSGFHSSKNENAFKRGFWGFQGSSGQTPQNGLNGPKWPFWEVCPEPPWRPQKPLTLLNYYPTVPLKHMTVWRHLLFWKSEILRMAAHFSPSCLGLMGKLWNSVDLVFQILFQFFLARWVTGSLNLDFSECQWWYSKFFNTFITLISTELFMNYKCSS